MNNFLKNRFFKTIENKNARCTSYLKWHYIKVSEADIKTWERNNQEDKNKKIKFKQDEEKNFEVHLIDIDNSIIQKLKLTEYDTKEEFIYPLENETNEFIIGEYQFSLGRDFCDNEDEEEEDE